MANFFRRYVSANIGLTAQAVGAYTVPASNTTTAIGLSVSNTANTTINVGVTLSNATHDFFIVKNAPIPVGGALVAIGGDQKVVLEAGDSIKVNSDIATSADAILSVLETTL